MSFIIGAECIDVMDRSCIDVCPVDCIYDGARKLYINPNECIDCGACESVCPVSAITSTRVMTPEDQPHAEDNARFFTEPLPGRSEPLGDPGGASLLGPVRVDTPFVQGAVA
jgi:NAD-dependent dihydropyrimidine dehydrogenase PreA subunit